jgi:hypothetical protein
MAKKNGPKGRMVEATNQEKTWIGSKKRIPKIGGGGEI